jgi:tetratricopeptide (TPR) repeat protein
VKRCTNSVAALDFVTLQYLPVIFGRRFIAHALLFLVAMAAAAAAAAHPEPGERIEALSFALERHPDDPQLLIERAGEYLNDGDPAAALRDLDRAEALAPYRPEVPLQRGAALLRLDRPREAERQLGLAIERAPSSEEARVLRGRALMRLDRPREAARDFERGIELSPRPTPDQFLEWARALAAPRVGRADEALRALDRGLIAVGESPALIEEAVRIECARGAHAAALERIERHPAAWGSSPARRARRGDVLRSAGRELEAQAEYSAALAELEVGSRRRGTSALETRLHEALRQGTPGTGAP